MKWYVSWPLDQGNDPAIFSGPAEQIARDEDFVKMLIRHVEILSDHLLERIRTILGDLLTATHSASHDIGLVEISAPG